MDGINGSQAASPQLPPDTGRIAGAGTASDGFREPIGGQWVSRTGTQPIPQWIHGLPDTDIALSTLDRWPGNASTDALVRDTEAQLRNQIAPPTNDPLANLTGPSILDQLRFESDNIKVGYAMGSVARDIDARIAAHPGVSSSNAASFSAALKDRAAGLSHGASAYATANPNLFAYKGQIYTTGDAMAGAVQRDQANVPQLRAYTPAMQEADAKMRMDREVLGHDDGLGISWGQTLYMYARGNNADMDGLRRAQAVGTGIDALIGVGGSFAAVGAARDGFALPGGQSQPIYEGRPTEIEPAARAEAEAVKAPQAAPASPPRIPDAFDRQAAATPVEMPHILEGNINPKGKAGGYHSRPGGGDRPSATMTQKLDGPNAQGVYTGKVSVTDPATGNLVPKKAASTFYPDTMSAADVEASVRHAYADALRGGFTGNGAFNGDSGHGFRIEGYERGGKIVTAYPLYKP
jgi:hypothetical protein